MLAGSAAQETNGLTSRTMLRKKRGHLGMLAACCHCSIFCYIVSALVMRKSFVKSVTCSVPGPGTLPACSLHALGFYCETIMANGSASGCMMGLGHLKDV